ncbi:hypothetical protein [Desertivirga xinjiangensis]|uniref:hypothetical protein n=1 Tax=Desertivirga xinjiangensis TaxID=539206 RepID=UPI00210A403D|nr:hypothetical protein [Pedobacter xinjiangensis]
MLTSISKSLQFRLVACLLIVATLSMSFRMRADGVVLNAGTSVILETATSLSSSTLAPGQIIDFKVRYDVKANEKTVIKAGSLARGQVLRVQKAKGLGKEGFVEIQLKSVKAVDGQEIPLTAGSIFHEGEDKQTLSIVLGVLVCILFLTMKGKNAEVPAGYETSGSVAVTTTINVE